MGRLTQTIVGVLPAATALSWCGDFGEYYYDPYSQPIYRQQPPTPETTAV